jgi:hypothetical protein
VRLSIRFALAVSMLFAAQAGMTQDTTQPVENAAPAVEPTTAAPPPAPTPTATTTSAPTQTPGRGLTMTQVKDKFGSPSQEVSAVGTPPIARWEYPGYVVFFEHDRVLHTVVMR